MREAEPLCNNLSWYKKWYLELWLSRSRDHKKIAKRAGSTSHIPYHSFTDAFHISAHMYGPKGASLWWADGKKKSSISFKMDRFCVSYCSTTSFRNTLTNHSERKSFWKAVVDSDSGHPLCVEKVAKGMLRSLGSEMPYMVDQEPEMNNITNYRSMWMELWEWVQSVRMFPWAATL